LQLLEEDELIWNDGVAPEACLDFDAPHVNSYEALAWWFGGIMLVYLTYRSMGLLDLQSWKKTVSWRLQRKLVLAHTLIYRLQESCPRVRALQMDYTRRRHTLVAHRL
jgi:hypothetical protein